MSSEFVTANAVFKELRALDWVHTSIGRRKATRALVKVLSLDSCGELELPHSTFPYIPPLLEASKSYNEEYLRIAFGTLRYLRGDYIGKTCEYNS